MLCNWHCIIYTLYGCDTVHVSVTLSNQYYKVHQELKSWVRVLIRMCSLYNLQWGEAGVCRAGASSGTFTLWGGEGGGARPSPLLPDVTPPHPWYNDTSAAGVLDKQIRKYHQTHSAGWWGQGHHLSIEPYYATRYCQDHVSLMYSKLWKLNAH